MHRIAIFIWPDGDVESKTQCDPKSGNIEEAVAFYAKLHGPIERFKDEIRKSISGRSTRKKMKIKN